MEGVVDCSAQAPDGSCLSWGVSIVQEVPQADPSTWGPSFVGGFSVVFGLFVVGVCIGYVFKLVHLAASA